MARGYLQRQRNGRGRVRYAIESSKWEKLKRSRVIRFERERTARGSLWHMPSPDRAGTKRDVTP